jgi:hypothetical protein
MKTIEQFLLEKKKLVYVISTGLWEFKLISILNICIQINLHI